MNLEQFYQRVINPPPPWRVSRVAISDDCTRVDVWLEHDSGYRFLCPECRKPCPTYDHTEERAWRHLDTCDSQTYLHARLPRVNCSEHKIKNGYFPIAEPGASLTSKMEVLYIRQLLACNRTNASELLGVSWDILQGVQTRAVKRGLERRGDAVPEKMGIDEKQVFARHKYFTIITDIAGQCVHDVIDQRAIDKISPWFEQRRDSLDAVKTLAMDMSAGYASVAGQYMPSAEICFDHFHIMQVVQNAVDKTRKDEQAAMDDEERKAMFASRYLFLYGRENLPEKHKDRFEKVKAVAVKTAKAWAIKEQIRDLWSGKLSEEEVSAFFQKWYWWATHSRLKHMISAARTLKRHLGGILAAVRNRISNAVTEGLNNKIESIKRAACGFKNKEAFRNAILFHCAKLDLMPSMS